MDYYNQLWVAVYAAKIANTSFPAFGPLQTRLMHARFVAGYADSVVETERERRRIDLSGLANALVKET